jgi:Tol biopolymer transport system component
MKIERLTREGTSFIRLCDEEGTYHYNLGYYSINRWVDDQRLVLGRSKNMYGWNGAEIVLVDLANETETVIITDSNSTESLVFGDLVYYMRGLDLVCYSISTAETRVVMDGEAHGASENVRPAFPHITTDGRYISLQNFPKERGDIHVWVVDTVTGEVEAFTLAPFAPTLWQVGHVMVSPTDKDKVFFCHEGTTQYISNRLWLHEKDKGSRVLVKQRLDEQGDLADCLGHECWCPDGKGLYYVKYPVFGKAPYGLGYVPLDGELTAPDVRFSKYRYWHVCVSPDGKKLASDTIERESGVCVIDLETGEEKCLLHTGPDRTHPTHPHPCFSPSSSRICFQDYREVDGKAQMLGVGIIDLK